MNCTLASWVAVLVLEPETLAPKSKAMGSSPEDQREGEDAAADDEPHTPAAAAERDERVPRCRIDRRDSRLRHGDRRLRLLIRGIGAAGGADQRLHEAVDVETVRRVVGRVDDRAALRP